MKLPFSIIAMATFIWSCVSQKNNLPITDIEIDEIYVDTQLSIRAIEIVDDKLFFAANLGTYGTIDLFTNEVSTRSVSYELERPEFRAVAHTESDLFMLSIASPALIYRISRDDETIDLVYEEHDSSVFYDAMKFWNNSEGIAIGDIMDGCLSIIITRDGGNSWSKLDCAQLPKAVSGEGAFAASNTNIDISGDYTWAATTAGRIFYSHNKGHSWQVFQTSVINEKPTQGIYSIDFYNEKIGVAIGGDYTSPEDMNSNKAISYDGGQNWQLVADNQEPNYKSCIQFVPGTSGKEIVAVGFTGISYSNDQGRSWSKLSEESFYTIRFINRDEAIAAGRGRIARISFR